MKNVKFKIVVDDKIMTMRDHSLVYDLDTSKWRLDMYSQGGEFCESREDIELLQSTGMRDENGVEIYEGDIVEFLFEYYSEIYREEIKKGEIGYQHNAFYFRVSDNEEYPLCELSYDSEADIKIIGNRYENPKLLESL